MKHFANKLLEEFIDKTKRGSPIVKLTFNEEYWEDAFKYYFSINNKTKERFYYIKKNLNINID